MKKNSVFQLLDSLRLDGWVNTLTGLGTARDKSTLTQFLRAAPLTDEHLEALYAENDMAARICDALPEDAAREGYQVNLGSDQRELAQDAQDRLDDLELLPKLVEAWVWGRVFGWGAVVLGADDGARGPALAEPLQLDRVRKFDHLNVIDKRHVSPQSWYNDPTERGYGRPRTYLVTPQAIPSGPTSARSAIGARLQAATAMDGALEIHESRLIVFTGIRTTVQRRRQGQGFDDSLIQRVNTVLQQFGVAWDSLAHILQDGYQGVYKLKGFIDAISGNNPDALQTRLSLMDMARSVVRAVVVDAEYEEFERHSLQLSGLDKVMELFMLRLAGAAGMPATVLLAQSPAGMNATGESDMRWWYNRVDYDRRNVLRPAIMRAAEVLFAAKDGPTGGAQPETLAIDFPKLWAPTEVEAATIRKSQAETDKIYYEMGALTESEIALSRFTEDGWSAETQIDRDARETMVEAEVEELAEPEPEPVVVAPGAASEPGQDPAPAPTD